MPRKKNKRTTVQNNSSITRWITNPLSLVIIITFGGLLLAGKLWGDYKTQLSSSNEFQVGPDSLSLNEPPIWLNRQSLKDCANRFHWEGRHLLDTSLAKDLFVHLGKQSWVQQVNQVHKTSENNIVASISYRVPVGMVQIGDQQLMPVDAKGYVLDGGDVTSNQVSNYIRIAIVGVRQDNLIAGSLWPDRRVPEASEIASSILPMKESLQIDGIYAVSPRKGLPTEFRFWTADRNEIIWGSAVGKETGTEAKAEKKFQILAQLIPDRRKQFPGYRSGGGNVFDLRGGTLQTASRPNWKIQFNRY